MKGLRDSQAVLETVLRDHFEDVADLDPRDNFPQKMFRFAREARERLAALMDKVTLADSAYEDALKFYGEDKKSVSSTQEFFAIFKTFVTSYRVSPFSF